MVLTYYLAKLAFLIKRSIIVWPNFPNYISRFPFSFRVIVSRDYSYNIALTGIEDNIVRMKPQIS